MGDGPLSFLNPEVSVQGVPGEEALPLLDFLPICFFPSKTRGASFFEKTPRATKFLFVSNFGFFSLGRVFVKVTFLGYFSTNLIRPCLSLPFQLQSHSISRFLAFPDESFLSRGSLGPGRKFQCFNSGDPPSFLHSRSHPRFFCFFLPTTVPLKKAGKKTTTSSI